MKNTFPSKCTSEIFSAKSSIIFFLIMCVFFARIVPTQGYRNSTYNLYTFVPTYQHSKTRFLNSYSKKNYIFIIWCYLIVDTNMRPKCS